MEKKTFEQFCDDVAKEYGFNSGWPAQQFWKAIKGKDAEIAYRKVCDLYADQEKKAYAREANPVFESNQMPDYDGRFLGFIVQKQECGTIWKYWRVVFCEFNVWKLEANERMTHWKPLPPEPQRTVKLL